jgi:hypothetical protein
MTQNYILGICVDTNDPQNLGRIRALPISEVGNTTSLSDIRSYVNSQDQIAESLKRYKLWYNTIISTYKERDKYLCDPFLPKNIGLLPLPGQLVKIISYGKDAPNEFVGPYTIDQVTLTEEYRNVVRNLQKTLDISEVIPKKTKTFLSGYNNEQIILGENEVLVRLAHINNNKRRQTTYPFIQLTQFGNSYNIENREVTITQSKNPAINNIAQLYIDYTPKTSKTTEQNFIGTLILYDASKIMNTQNLLGLTKNNYSADKEYITKTIDNYIVKHVFTTSNMSDFTSILIKILQSYKNDSKIEYFNNSNTSTIQIINDATKNQTIVTYNKLTSNPTSGGGVHDVPNQITGGLRNWKFRLDPNINIKNYSGTLDPPTTDQNTIAYKNYSDFVQLSNFIDKYEDLLRTELNHGELTDNSDTKITTKQDVPVQTGQGQSVNTMYSDKFLFLSSINSQSLISDTTSDGLTATKIAEILYGTNENLKTYGFLRAEPMLTLIKDVLDMLLNHGHVAGQDEPRDSIIEDSKKKITALQTRIENELKQNQNNVIVNHNLRLN